MNQMRPIFTSTVTAALFSRFRVLQVHVIRHVMIIHWFDVYTFCLVIYHQNKLLCVTASDDQSAKWMSCGNMVHNMTSFDNTEALQKNPISVQFLLRALFFCSFILKVELDHKAWLRQYQNPGLIFQ